MISSSPTLGQGFERALRYQRLLHDDAQSELFADRDEVAYRHQIGRPPFRAPSLALEFGFLSQLAREVQRPAARGAMMAHMEGPLFVIKSWALAALGLWLYRRYFERVAKREPEFEAWSRTDPLLAALHGNDPALARIEGALLAHLGKRSC